MLDVSKEHRFFVFKGTRDQEECQNWIDGNIWDMLAGKVNGQVRELWKRLRQECIIRSAAKG